jgi:hypothetical protein
MTKDKRENSERPMAGRSDDGMQGEGNVAAARRYNEASREHANNADVESEARDAAPGSDDEADQLEQAEDQGRARAAEEDPLLDEPERIDRDGESGDEADERSSQ